MSITVTLWTKQDLENTKSDPHLATILGNRKGFSNAELLTYRSLTFKTYRVYFEGDPEPHQVNAIDDASLFWFLEQEYYTDEILEIHEFWEEERELSLDSLAKNPRFTMEEYATIYH